MDVRDLIVNLLKNGCVKAKRPELLLSEFIYTKGNEVCVDSKEDLALWAVIWGYLSEGEVARYLSWRSFERYVMKIFSEAGFQTRHSVRFRTLERLMEFDVIAYDGRKVFVIECKAWNKGSIQAIKKVAREHRLKVIEASDYLRKYGKIGIPIVVTLKGRPLISDSIIVPIRYIRDFVQKMDEVIYDYDYVQLGH
ncbi:hypothetical protein EYM_04820 [Ignicoccus islandicus DSM 13165]|uniref:Restriction endonuclease type IV Mrr domain-containing protein n=1 Tax=Ignicoccus islandicus DSM 13165 TaxID=940295 RepID=A0A0U3DYA7_9CREN|nr:restriction endonuclease [Ignicoccus islandicus]ALU12522.1 hypothetical protein EYM_04820 [Ignicoccus islandicus DSM 13165]